MEGKDPMGKGLRIVVGAPAVVFLALGIGWLVVPAGVGPQLGMTLQEAVGLSTQIGDLASFFLTLGGCVLIALITGNRFWFYPPIMLLGFAAFGRVVAWFFHDAAFAYDMIAVEVAVAALLVFASRRQAASLVNRRP
jgi:hypothetical protein